MRGLRILLFIVVPLSFAFGLGWGWKIKHDRDIANGKIETNEVVRVLALKGLIPPATINEFQASEKIVIKLTEADSPHDVLQKLAAMSRADEGPDLVTILASNDQNPEVKLQPFDLNSIGRLKTISQDFLDLPNAKLHVAMVPLAWGFNGWALTKPPPGTPSVLWIECLALTAQAKDVSGAHRFVNELLSRSAVLARIKSSKLASTSLEAESAEIDAKLKPSFLRSVPLTDYVLDISSPVRASQPGY